MKWIEQKKSSKFPYKKKSKSEKNEPRYIKKELKKKYG